MTPQEREARALRIRAIMEDGEVASAFNEVEADLVDDWRRCFDPVERDNIWRTLRGVSLVRQKLAASGGLSSFDRTAIRRVK